MVKLISIALFLPTTLALPFNLFGQKQQEKAPWHFQHNQEHHYQPKPHWQPKPYTLTGSPEVYQPTVAPYVPTGHNGYFNIPTGTGTAIPTGTSIPIATGTGTGTAAYPTGTGFSYRSLEKRQVDAEARPQLEARFEQRHEVRHGGHHGKFEGPRKEHENFYFPYAPHPWHSFPTQPTHPTGSGVMPTGTAPVGPTMPSSGMPFPTAPYPTGSYY